MSTLVREGAPPVGNGAAQERRFRRIASAFAHYREVGSGAHELLRKVAHTQDPFFRVSLFGGHQVRKETEAYEAGLHMARLLDAERMDILHGGGPGIMEAAGINVTNGSPVGKGIPTISIAVQLGFVDQLQLDRHHLSFQALGFEDRLKIFYMLSGGGICMKGCKGTKLEAAYFEQISQKVAIAHRAARSKAGITDPEEFLPTEGLPEEQYLYTPHPFARLGYIPKIYYVGEHWAPQREQDQIFHDADLLRAEDQALSVFVKTPEEAIAGLSNDRLKFRQILRHYGIEPLN